MPKKKLIPWRVAICGGKHIAGTADCFRQDLIWVCKCLKKPVNNYELLMIFVQQVSVTKLHLSEEKNKWENFADSLIAKFPAHFGPPSLLPHQRLHGAVAPDLLPGGGQAEAQGLQADGVRGAGRHWQHV
jgi:hypothetical protein